jgi:hypothetical protein
VSCGSRVNQRLTGAGDLGQTGTPVLGLQTPANAGRLQKHNQPVCHTKAMYHAGAYEPSPCGWQLFVWCWGRPTNRRGGGGIWLHPYTPCGDWLSSRLTRTLLPNIGDKPPGAGISVVPLPPPSPVVLANNLVNPHPPVKSSACHHPCTVVCGAPLGHAACLVCVT